MNKIVIVHFQQIEKYPPVMNIINSISLLEKIYCKVYTINNSYNNWFVSEKVTINRVGANNNNSILRYWCYFKFNVITFFSLLINYPKVIVAFETYSILPIYFYKKLFSKTNVYIHYHEYTSLQEIKNSSLYFKVLHILEKKLFCTCNYISHTNEDRVELFLKDFPFVKESKMIVSPNIPPSQWYEFSKRNKKENTSEITRLVHVGALSLETMHVEKIVEWVIAQKGFFTLDFYTDNITDDARKFIEGLQNNYIQLHDSINYFDLPKVLIHYDIGLTLYNGHIPNYVFNVPNKVLEYLACGLGVWYPNELISTRKFIKEYRINGCSGIDFQTKETINFNLTEDLKNYNANEKFVALLFAPNELLKIISSHLSKLISAH